jgi:hypothetical protein
MSDETSSDSTGTEPIANPAESEENGSADEQKPKAPDNSSATLDLQSRTCYSYTAKGVLVYTEPETNQKFVLNEAGSDWVKKEDNDDDETKDLEYGFDGRTYSCTKDGKDYEWDIETNTWKVKVGSVKSNEADDDSGSELEDDDEETPEEKAQRQYRKRKAAPGWAKEVCFNTITCELWFTVVLQYYGITLRNFLFPGRVHERPFHGSAAASRCHRRHDLRIRRGQISVVSQDRRGLYGAVSDELRFHA